MLRFILVTFFVALTICLTAYYQYTLAQSRLVLALVPTFQRGDCFEGTMEKEVWEKSPDGIIERVGKASYLIIERHEAERHGDKYGSSMPIAAFDQLHVKTKCPIEWVQHTHRKEK